MRKILIVDDNQDNRTTLKLLLDDFESLSISEAQDGKEAVRLCSANKFDLIFMDIMMPVMDGITATAEIRLFDKNAMIVAVSALNDDDNKRAILKAGAEDYITKPINSDLFIKRMESYISLIDSRRFRDHETTPINIFGIPVFSRSVVFNVKRESNLAEFWEYYLIDNVNNADTLSDCVRCIYNIGLELLKKARFFYIIVEEDERQLYFSLLNFKNLDVETVTEIVRKEFKVSHFTYESDKISLFSPKQKVTVPTVAAAQVSNKQLGELLGIDSEELGILRKTHFDKISAEEYVNEMAVDFMDKLEELEAIEESADSTIYEYEREGDIASVRKLGLYVEEYAAIIDSLYEFKHLAFAINSLAEFLSRADDEGLTQKKKGALSLLLRCIIQDLAQWRKTVFVEKSTADIHYLDSSLLSSCMQIELLFRKEESAELDDELELF